AAKRGAPVITLPEQRTGARSPVFEREGATDASLQAVVASGHLLSGPRSDPELGAGLLGPDRWRLSSVAGSHRVDRADGSHLSYRSILRILRYALAPFTSARTNGTSVSTNAAMVAVLRKRLDERSRASIRSGCEGRRSGDPERPPDPP